MTQLPLLLEPEALQAILANPPVHPRLLIVDLCQYAVYQQAHVPGAIHLDYRYLLKGEQPSPGMLPDRDALTALFSHIGLTADSHVIAYDDEGGGWAGRLIWTLDMIGHSHYSYLDGGIHAWIGAGLHTESGESAPTPSHYTVASIHTAPEVDRHYIASRLGSADFAIWDARSHDEFVGNRALAAKGGHIPGAKHFEWTAGMDRQRDLRVMDLQKLQARLDALGLTRDKEIVTHCQTHHRSSFTYLLGRILGYPRIRAYAGSWSDWGNAPDTPVETGEA